MTFIERSVPREDRDDVDAVETVDVHAEIRATIARLRELAAELDAARLEAKLRESLGDRGQ